MPKPSAPGEGADTRTRHPAVTRTVLPSRPVEAPSGRFNPFLHRSPARPPAAPLVTPPGPAADVLPDPVGCDPASVDLLMARYARSLRGPVQDAAKLRVLVTGLLAERTELIAQHLEDAAQVCDLEPLHANDASGLRHAAQVVRRVR